MNFKEYRFFISLWLLKYKDFYKWFKLLFKNTIVYKIYTYSLLKYKKIKYKKFNILLYSVILY